MAKITYLIGAGASCAAMPLVNDIPKRIESLIKFIEDYDIKYCPIKEFFDIQNDDPKSIEDYHSDLLNHLKWLLKECQNHYSIDTYAKMLFLKRNFDDLKKLKVALSIYFSLEHGRNNLDKRYNVFLASLFNNLSELPDNVVILSWNYDYQFEIAFSEFTGLDEIRPNQEWLKIKTKYRINPIDEGFSIYKLNGSIELFHEFKVNQKNKFDYFIRPNLNGPINQRFFDSMLRYFIAATNSKKYQSSLSFAWEPEAKESSLIRNMKSKILDSEIFIIIGYSFPFFNRDIDKEIIANMPQLKYIYIQDPNSVKLKESLLEIFDNLSHIEIVCKTDVNEFFIPRLKRLSTNR